MPCVPRTQINTVFAARKKLFATATLLRANVDVRDQRGQELMIKLVGYLNAAVIVTFTGMCAETWRGTTRVIL